MRRMDGWGREIGGKKEGEKVVGEKGKTGRSRRTPTHAVPTPISSSSSFLFFSGEWKCTREAEWRTTGPQQLRSHFISHSAVFSFPIHSLYSLSLPLSPAVPLLFCLHSSSRFHYLPPPVSFHVVTHYSTDIAPSVPLSISPTISPLLVLAFTPVSWPGQARGQRGVWGGLWDRWTEPELQKRRERWKKRRRAEQRRGEEGTQGSVMKNGKDQKTHTWKQHTHSPHVSGNRQCDNVWRILPWRMTRMKKHTRWSISLYVSTSTLTSRNLNSVT